MTRLLCVWLPNWPIQRLWTARRNAVVAPEENLTDDLDDLSLEELSGSPVPSGPPTVLWHEDARRGRLVVACCAAARALGVRPAMKIAQASELIQCSSHVCGEEVIQQQHDRLLDQEMLEQIALAWCLSHPLMTSMLTTLAYYF